jgi:hypothetical protein
MKNLLLIAALCSGGCSLIQNDLGFDYSFDAQEVKQSLGQGVTMMTLPTVACTPGANPDPCLALAAQVPPTSGSKLACVNNQCTATAEFSIPQKVDLRMAKTPVPDAVLNFAIDRVSVSKIAYWVQNNTLTVDTPKVDIYVAPESVMDAKAAGATLVGSVASLPKMSKACGDAPDTADPAAKMGQTVCDMMLTGPGQEALAGFVKNFKTAPFNIIAHATLVAKGGETVPSGDIHLFVRPTVRFSIIK